MGVSAPPPAASSAQPAPAAGPAVAAAGPGIGIAALPPPEQSFASAGIIIHFQYAVTNTGDQTLTGVTLRNSLAGITFAFCEMRTLAPGASTDCVAPYTTTQADVTAGGVTNVATAVGTPPAGPAVLSLPVSVTVPALAAPAVALIKGTLQERFTRAGQSIRYLYGVFNTGNATLTDITVHDPHPGLGPVRCAESLAPGRLGFCFADYTTTQADVAAGKITDTAKVTATPPTGPAVSSLPSTATIPLASPLLVPPNQRPRQVRPRFVFIPVPIPVTWSDR
ncbi:hypothetical protein I6A84_29560 [Frankia sp. CNm7]|uniref:DUF7507 domain-containing protein n=2 Tax=Frankia nepalensis TaxID=1836974 RepID=A0A937RDD4_9ACTN|nr:hypothetical protein [Frankia nepalensis]MBL7508841.1 hypothetical protein [Frankia nepalensis]MBL7522112.1 hypothetical protein [Frankia nepalensis]MBL7630066.1 hypothetical protein [Frankia nepalensis]